MIHQYIERETGKVITEKLYGDNFVKLLYSPQNENHNLLLKALTGKRFTKILAYLNYDSILSKKLIGAKRLIKRLNIDVSECLQPLSELDTPRKVFERKIRYWEVRPMSNDSDEIVSPSDAKVLIGSLKEDSLFFIKEKFFDFKELLIKPQWIDAFKDGDYAIFRLTPEKYHYNHCPVSGIVIDFYEADGLYHSCNPHALTRLINPYSKNRRSITIIDTDVDDGTKIGLVAMIEIAALMIGEIVQCYSEHEYHDPQPMRLNLFLKKGQPKSLFKPGSSTVILFFQKDSICFAEDLILNQFRKGVQTRFSRAFTIPLVETDIKVRSKLALKRKNT